MRSNSSSPAGRAPGFVALFAALIMAAGGSASAAPTETVLHSFSGSDGIFPTNGFLIADSKGNLYGTTVEGGKPGCFGTGCGVVFKLSPGGAETVLYSFTGGSDGGVPEAGLIADSAGNLYGTTEIGGPACSSSLVGCGTVFKLSPGGTETVLHTFTGSDGASPLAGLIADTAGNLYGTTELGGASNNGVVFKLSPDGTETVLHSFTGGSDGANPFAGLIADSAGNLYGTTAGGGVPGCFGYGCGVVFKLSPGGTETVLYSFCSKPSCSDGATPDAGLIADSAGNLYGTTNEGGKSGCFGNGCGLVFKLSLDGTETVLHYFAGSDGAHPYAGLIADSKGNLYGTTSQGGAAGKGVAFKLSPGGPELHYFTGWTETVLYSFCSKSSCSDGNLPGAGLIADSKGNLYGTTDFGGAGGISCGQFECGLVFELTGAGFVPPPPGVPFLAFSARLAIAFGTAPNEDSFDLHSSFTLSSTAPGLHPHRDPVTLQVGTFSITTPPRSFREQPDGSFFFVGMINGVSLKAQIYNTGTLQYAFHAKATGASLTGTTNPVYVTLIISGDSGATSVTAQISP